VVAALVVSAAATSASGALLAGWNFNGLAAPVGASVASQHGSGTIDLSAFSSGLAWQAGTDLNAWSGDAAGDALAFTGTGANGKSAVFTMSTGGHESLAFSLAARATGTGHLQSVIEAWNGSDWVGVGGLSLTASVWSTASFDLAAYDFLEDGTATLRLRLEGASSAQGNLRIDNVRLEGASVPAPGAVVMAASALLLRRRRRA